MTCDYICPVPFSEAVFQIYSLSDAKVPTEKLFWFISLSLLRYWLLSLHWSQWVWVPAETPRATQTKQRQSASPGWALWGSFPQSPGVWMSLGAGQAKSGLGGEQEERRQPQSFLRSVERMSLPL